MSEGSAKGSTMSPVTKGVDFAWDGRLPIAMAPIQLFDLFKHV